MTQALDLNFRFENGYCHSQNKPGFNPNYLGECGNLTGSQLIEQNHQNLNLMGANMSAVYGFRLFVKKGDLSFSLFRRALIIESKFEHINGESLDLKGASLKGVIFTNGTMKKTSARGARLNKVIFKNCDLQGADFTQTHLQSTQFINSDLRGANLSESQVFLTQFQGSKFNQKTQLPFSQQEAIKRGMVKVD